MNERGFPPPPAKGEKGHSDGNSLPSFPLVLVCCCSPSKAKQNHQSVLAQAMPTAQFQVQASAFESPPKPFTLSQCFLQKLQQRVPRCDSTTQDKGRLVASATVPRE